MMCELCGPKDELIAVLRKLANGMQDTIVNLIETLDAAKPHLPEAAWPIVDGLKADATKLAASHV